MHAERQDNVHQGWGAPDTGLREGRGRVRPKGFVVLTQLSVIDNLIDAMVGVPEMTQEINFLDSREIVVSLVDVFHRQ